MLFHLRQIERSEIHEASAHECERKKYKDFKVDTFDGHQANMS